MAYNVLEKPNARGVLLPLGRDYEVIKVPLCSILIFYYVVLAVVF